MNSGNSPIGPDDKHRVMELPSLRVAFRMRQEHCDPPASSLLTYAVDPAVRTWSDPGRSNSGGKMVTTKAQLGRYNPLGTLVRSDVDCHFNRTVIMCNVSKLGC